MPARQLHGVVASDGIDALRQLCNQARQVGGLQAICHPLAIHFLPKRHINGNAVVEHQHMLADQRELGTQGLQIPFAQRVAVQFDAARAELNKTRQQADQRCLARP